MSLHLRSTASGLAAGLVAGLVLAGGTAYAATGGTFVLGKANTAGTQTVLRNTGSGPVLALSTRGGQPPLAVSSGSGKATNLDADRLDGQDASAFALVSGRTGSVEGSAGFVDLDEDGTADVLLAGATCPAGTQLTGGGAENFAGPLVYDLPVNGTWLVAAVVLSDQTTEDDLVAVAQCYSPRGAALGGGRLTAAPEPVELTDEQRAQLLRSSRRAG